MGDKTSTKISA